jgi:hypothetical protein
MKTHGASAPCVFISNNILCRAFNLVGVVASISDNCKAPLTVQSSLGLTFFVNSYNDFTRNSD